MSVFSLRKLLRESGERIDSIKTMPQLNLH